MKYDEWELAIKWLTGHARMAAAESEPPVDGLHSTTLRVQYLGKPYASRGVGHSRAQSAQRAALKLWRKVNRPYRRQPA